MMTIYLDVLQRNYDVSFPHKKISDKLSILAKKLAMPAMPVGTEFSPEGAIVNYFGEGTCSCHAHKISII